MANKDKVLSAKELAFIGFYLEDLNGAQAAIKAGYDVKSETASGIAHRILRRPKVQLEIKRQQAALSKYNVATSAEIMDYFSRVMRGEVLDQFGLEAPLSERTKAAAELAKRTIDIEQKTEGKQPQHIELTLDW